MYSTHPSRRRCRSYWNSDFSLDIAKYCISRSHRVTMDSLSSRVTGNFVHSCMPADFMIRDFALLYLNKGSKYIIDRHMCSLAEVVGSICCFQRRLNIAKFFDDVRVTHRKPCTAKSSWQPPSNNEISTFCRMLRHDIIQHFVDKPLRRNLGWLDGKAIQWLRLHRSQIVVSGNLMQQSIVNGPSWQGVA